MTGSCLINKYSEGYPAARYYGGNEHIDEIETLAQKRTLEAFGLEEDEWHPNVQPYNGTSAVSAVLTAFLEPGDSFMCLSTDDGGFHSH